MLSLRERLLVAEDDYLSALVGGEEAMLAFEARWEAILAEVDSALDTSGLDDQTITLVHTTSLRIAALADASAELFDSYNLLSAQLMTQLDSMMHELTIHDRPSPRRKLSSPPHSEDSQVYGKPPTTCKRKRSSAGVLETAAKRPRIANDASLKDSSTLFSTEFTTSLSPSPPVSTYNPPRRKRRLSDADACSPPGRVKRLHMGPRIHAVSDSYTITRPRDSELQLEGTDVGLQLSCMNPVNSLSPSTPIDVCHLSSTIPDVQLPEAASIDYHSSSSQSLDAPLQEFPHLDELLESFLNAPGADSLIEDVTSTPPFNPYPLELLLQAVPSSRLPPSSPQPSLDSSCSTPSTLSPTPLTPLSFVPRDLHSPPPYQEDLPELFELVPCSTSYSSNSSCEAAGLLAKCEGFTFASSILDDSMNPDGERNGEWSHGVFWQTLPPLYGASTSDALDVLGISGVAPSKLSERVEGSEGWKTMRPTAQLPPLSESISIITSPKVTQGIPAKTKEHEVPAFWLHPGAEDEVVVSCLEDRVIYGGPYTFVDGDGVIQSLL